jgi:tetratricopeptide (TPR) repeat protein
MTNTDSVANDRARELLRQALALHHAERIDDALALARDALEADPTLGEAHAYIGNTLVTRKRRFADGLAELERALELTPDDPGIAYTLGWCQEFAANAIARPRGRAWHQAPAQSADELYEAAQSSMLRARALNPEEGLKGDIEDILDVISKVTGIPWDTIDNPDGYPADRRVL